MLRSIQLKNFKAFRQFSVTFPGDTFLVGPNNAGKSTVIAALRAAANMIRMGTRSRAEDLIDVAGEDSPGHYFTGPSVGINEANLRHHGNEDDSQLVARFDNDAELRATWPAGEY